MRTVAALTLLAALAAWIVVRTLPSEAAPAPPAGLTQQIRSISLDGKRLPDAELRAALATHVGDQLDAQRLDRDRAALEATLAARGYLAARVDPAAVTFGPGGFAYINFEIDQGRIFHLRDVRVTGAGKDAAVVTIARGDDAIRARIDHARQALADALARRGKPARVALRVQTDPANAAVDVELRTE